MVMSTTGGFVFNILTIILPKVVDVRGGGNIPLVIVSSVATAIFLCGAVAQFAVGRILGRVQAHLLARCTGDHAVRCLVVGDVRERLGADRGARRSRWPRSTGR